MTGLPIRVRIAVAFVLAMAVVLAGTGFFLYAQLGTDLDHALDDDLRLRGQDLSTTVPTGDIKLSAQGGARLIEKGESFAQLIDRSNRVLDATRTLTRSPLLTQTEINRALHRSVFFDRSQVPGLDEPARLLGVPIVRGGRDLVLVVGATRENRAEALRSLRKELLIAGPIALLLATGLGYGLAGAGLRAVDAMRRHAAGVSLEQPGERLPLPVANDELRRLGLTLNEMLARLEGALERERGFVADAGHELRTPLTLIRAELDYALHHAEDEQELRAAVAVASEEVDRLIQLASGLLLIASSEGDSVELRVEPLDARDTLQSVCNRFAWRAETAARSLQLDAQPGLTLSGDRLRLEQALGNLVENALRHGDGSIGLHASQTETRTVFSVTDEGRGFPEAFIPHAFERFTRGDRSRHGDGAGLGLSIADAIARAHGGRARIGNGRPTEVSIEIPAGPRLRA